MEVLKEASHVSEDAKSNDKNDSDVIVVNVIEDNRTHSLDENNELMV